MIRTYNDHPHDSRRSDLCRNRGPWTRSRSIPCFLLGGSGADCLIGIYRRWASSCDDYSIDPGWAAVIDRVRRATGLSCDNDRMHVRRRATPLCLLPIPDRRVVCRHARHGYTRAYAGFGVKDRCQVVHDDPHRALDSRGRTRKQAQRVSAPVGSAYSSWKGTVRPAERCRDRRSDPGHPRCRSRAARPPARRLQRASARR